MPIPTFFWFNRSTAAACWKRPEGSPPLGAKHRAATLYAVGSARDPDHEAVIRFSGEAPRRRAHSADGIEAMELFGSPPLRLVIDGLSRKRDRTSNGVFLLLDDPSRSGRRPQCNASRDFAGRDHAPQRDEQFAASATIIVVLRAPFGHSVRPRYHCASALSFWNLRNRQASWIRPRRTRALPALAFYDPEINRSYGMMAAHYGVGVLPARPRKPRDKAKVEAGVRFAQTYILGRLRRQTFFSLAEANAAIATAMERINAHLMRRLGVSRRELFESIERPALRPLPSDDYEYAEWRLARVNLDYHVEAAGFLYSVPHALIRQQVDVRLTSRTVEIFHRGRRVAAHERRHGGRRHGTDPEHMPSAHRRYAEWTPERFQRWARSIGPNTEGLVIAVLSGRPHRVVAQLVVVVEVFIPQRDAEHPLRHHRWRWSSRRRAHRSGQAARALPGRGPLARDLPDALRRPAPAAVEADARTAFLARPARPAPAAVSGTGPEPAARLDPLRPRPEAGGPCRA